MKKIAFISSGYLPLPSVKGGAVETLIDILLNSSKVQNKYQIDVYSIYDKEAFEESSKQNKINYIYLKPCFIIKKVFRYIINKYTRKYIGNDYIINLIKNYKEKLSNYDYVIIENKPEFSLTLRKYIKGKLIFHSHNDFLNKDTKHAKEILKSYDCIYALSEYICNRICEIDEQEGKKKVKLLYNGVDTKKFENPPMKEIQEIKKKLKLSQDDIVILYTGRLVEEKGIKELIQAFNKLNNDKLKLIITGDINPRNYKLKMFVHELKKISNKNKNIIFTGYINYHKIPLYYNIADVGVIPSIWEEPFALTVIEHLAAGHPVIVSNSGAMPELVNNNVAIVVNKSFNFVNNLSEALLKVKSNTTNNKRLCILQAKKFDKSNYINRFIELLSEEE